MALDAATIGPVEYALIAFPGSEFNGDVEPALEEAVRAGTIRIIDLAFVTKDASGAVESAELTSLPAALVETFDRLDGEISGLLSQDDILTLGDGLAPGDSGLLVVWEAVWATRLANAVRASRGQVVFSGQVPRELVVTAVEALAAP